MSNNKDHDNTKLPLDTLIKIVLPIISAIWWVSTLSMRVVNLEEYHSRISTEFVTKTDEKLVELRFLQLQKDLDKLQSELDSIKIILRRVN